MFHHDSLFIPITRDSKNLKEIYKSEDRIPVTFNDFNAKLMYASAFILWLNFDNGFKGYELMGHWFIGINLELCSWFLYHKIIRLWTYPTDIINHHKKPIMHHISFSIWPNIKHPFFFLEEHSKRQVDN